MNLLENIAIWNKRHEQAVADLVRYETREDWKPYEMEFKAFVEWIFETELNPWSFMPKGWEGSTESALGMDHFLGVVNHALIDDGDICFSSEKDSSQRPRIIFSCMYDMKDSDMPSAGRYTEYSYYFHHDVHRFIRESDEHETNFEKLVAKNEAWEKKVNAALKKELDDEMDGN